MILGGQVLPKKTNLEWLLYLVSVLFGPPGLFSIHSFTVLSALKCSVVEAQYYFCT